MNIAQTRQVMAYIWATHPSAPKYTDDDKARTVASYFRVLCKYSVDDVMAAVDIICRESPTFIPSAYEIEKKCTKTVKVDAFLPREYYEVMDRLDDADNRRAILCAEYEAAFRERDKIMREYASVSFADETRQNERLEEYRQKCAPFETVIDRYCEMSAECRHLKERLNELYYRATWAAQDAYDREQSQLAHNDLCALGYERLALEE